MRADVVLTPIFFIALATAIGNVACSSPFGGGGSEGGPMGGSAHGADPSPPPPPLWDVPDGDVWWDTSIPTDVGGDGGSLDASPEGGGPYDDGGAPDDGGVHEGGPGCGDGGVSPDGGISDGSWLCPDGSTPDRVCDAAGMCWDICGVTSAKPR